MPATTKYSSYEYSTSASVTSTQDGETTTRDWGKHSAQRVYRDDEGNTTVRTFTHTLGEEPVIEEKRYDREGRLLAVERQRGGEGRIESLDEEGRATIEGANEQKGT